jgi:hypothetical protein
LYLLHHEEWGLHKVGITNEPEVRLATHKRLGFTAIDIEGPMSGDLALAWETSILQELRNAGVGIPSKALRNAFSGWSECWSESQLRVMKIRELRDRVEATEQSS